MPLVVLAQDDMYFVPTKANVAKEAAKISVPRETYYSGSNRDVDEYNRRGTYVQEIDSLGNDVIDFDAVEGVYPDSLAVGMSEDYTCTREMSRFDDYAWSDPYWAGYYAGRSSRWWGYDPWFYSSWYYDPWYYGWYGGWYGWYGGYYGWLGHYWWGHPHYVASYHSGPTGTFNHTRGTGRRPLAGYSGVNSISSGISNRNRALTNNIRNRSFSASERFGTNRNTNIMRNNVPSSNNSSFSRGGFGGSRSTGGFSGGSRSGGGGSHGGFGGRR